MDARWAFLQPWLEAMQSVLVRPGEMPPRQDEQRFATFSCWPSISDLGGDIAECTLYVVLPADQASRQDSDRLQRIREAVTIFDTLAAVDNAAFAAGLSEYMHRRQLKSRPPLAVYPGWQFSLCGFLSADDSVTRAPYVTWGELLVGSPEATWEHSPEFRDAMKRLQSDGIGPMGSYRNSKILIEWEIKAKVMNIAGKQELKPTKCSPLSDKLGKLMMLEAPPVFVIESVNDSDSVALIKSWQADLSTRCVDIEAKVGTTVLRFPKYEASGIGQVAAALAHAEMPTLELWLQGFSADFGRAGQAIANAGFFFSVLCSGRTACNLKGVMNFPALERHKETGCLDVIYSPASDLMFGGLFSAIAEGNMIRKLVVETDEDDMPHAALHWEWLAYAFWSRSSNARIPSLKFGRINLTEEHVDAIGVVLKCSYPQPAEHPASSHSQYGFASIRAGTELRPIGLRAGDDTVLVVSRDLRCRAHFKSSAVGDQLHVVVPGYGICTTTNVDVFESDDVVGSPSSCDDTDDTRCGVRSLSIPFSDIENDDLLPRFLALIGARLRTLILRYCFAFHRSVALDLSSVAAACPELQTLRVFNFEVTISDDNDALRSWNLKKLHIIGGSGVTGFIRLLDDPSYTTSRELVELRIGHTPNDQRHQFRLALDALNALKRHDGELLPVVKEKFPLRSKIAFISVVSCRAGRFIDSSVLSIVFAFAAIPEKRRVVISYKRS